jgi:hypothetical protein
MNERRKHPRIRFGFKVEDAGRKRDWMTDDISSGGCFLQALEKMAPGTKMSLIFQLPGSSTYIEAVGEVKHLAEEGMGVKFIAMDGKGAAETKKFVEDYIRFQGKEKKAY